MFISLSKKILAFLVVFLIAISVIFLALFSNFYADKLENGYDTTLNTKQNIIDLLNENIKLRKQLSDSIQQNQNIKSCNINLINKEISNDELEKQRKLSVELQKSYYNNTDTLMSGLKILIIGSLFTIIFIILLIAFLDYWVIFPIDSLTEISKQVANGILSNRIEISSHKWLNDEFDILCKTFNQMLDKTEENIKEIKIREMFLQQLIDSIPNGIRVIDKNYNVVQVNKAFEQMFNNQNCLGTKCYQEYGYNCEGCSQSKFKCPLQEFLNSKTDFLHTIHEVKGKPLYISATQFASANNWYVVESFHDLSEDVRFSHQQKVSSLAFLSTSIAHEMKNNLGSIRMVLEGILDNYYADIPEGSEQKQLLQMVHNQLIETIRVPERLLKLAQYSENETMEINLSESIKDMLLMLDYDAKRRGINVVTKTDDSLMVAGNESDFKMIILNLAQNAIKAMPEGGTLSINLCKKSKFAIIDIEDTGIGINPEQLKHIFEPFYSANSHAKSSGLGLAIVKNLIERFGGQISVKSKENKGTNFTIKLPLK